MKKTIALIWFALLWQISYSQQVSIPPIIKGLTIMVAYQDYPFNDPIQSVDDLMNKPGYNENGHLGSVRDYFYTQTDGKVTITSTVVKVNLAYTKQYYETNHVNYVDEAIDSINKKYPDGFQGLTPDPIDGKLLHMNFIERGPGGGGVTNGASAGKFVKNNTTGQIEIGQGNISSYPAGVPIKTNTICHEMGHSVMSWTDYYRTAFCMLGKYDVMGTGGTDYAPQPINPALRMQRGWIDNIINISGTTTETYILTANSYNTVHKYTNPNNPKEYLLFHALKIGGYYTQTPMPEGLAIWYVDEETGYDSPLNPNDDNQRFIRLVQADNKDEMHDDYFGATDVGGDMEDLYGTTNKSFPNGTPFRWKDGGDFGIEITNISNPGPTMQFTVVARPNTVVASSDIFGNISPKGTLSVANGQSKTFNLTPNPGYELDVLKVDGSNVSATNSYTLSGISGTKTISASFKRKATQTALPNPWQKASIGSVSSSDLVANSGNDFYLETYGNSVGGSSDNFTFAYQVINGDGTYIVHLANYNTTQDLKTGLMIRESLAPDAAYSAIAKTDMGGAVVIQRASSGAETQNNPNGVKELHRYELHNWLKIVRTGDQIESYTSKDGSNWYEFGNQTISMASQAYVGLFAKGNTSYPTQALFDDITFTSDPFPTVSITSPVNGTEYTANTVTINATAAPSVTNGSITKVDFYDNNILIGTDNFAPFSFVWNNVSGGIHAIKAKATDNTGKVAVSGKVAIVAPCTSGDAKIQGTVIGTTGSWNNSGNTREKAFDGDINTYFDANQSVAWAGLSLNDNYKVTNIRYVPRQGLESRMVGGKFQGSNSADFSTYTDLATVLAKPANGWNCFDVSNASAFRYLRYIGPEGAVGNVSEVEFYGTVQAANESPTIVITSPESGNSFNSPANITIEADASDSDGSIVKVEFYAGVNYLTRDTTYPYSTTISNLPSGVYSFTAIAYDNEGATSEFTVSDITVGTNTAPTISITSPVTYQSFTAPVAITINTDVFDAEGNVWKVEFYNGSTWLGSDFTAPYSYTWNNVPAGVYNITALAIDNQNATASSTRNNIAVTTPNQAPTVSITSPVTNQSFNAPATINIDVDASDVDGSITKVDFYNGSTLLGSDFTAPYSFAWNNVPAGVYNITALAIDNLGASASSTRNNIAVINNQAPTVNITSPASNASFVAPANITVNATASDADGSIVKVEFYNGSNFLNSDFTAPYSYTWQSVSAGTYSITARAIDNTGAYTEHTITNISVTNSTADISGPACASNNTTITYELSAAKRVNANNYGWYFTGSTQSFNPSGYQATLVTGNNYGAGQLCVGVGYNGPPYHTTYCITVPKCSSARLAEVNATEETNVSSTLAYPNPFNGETTVSLANGNIQSSIQVYNATGMMVEETVAIGEFKFGSNLRSGVYMLKINTEGKVETLKLIKE